MKGKKKVRTLKSNTMLGICICLLPALIIYTYVAVIPIFRSFYLSAFSWSGGPEMKFVRLKNYSILMRDTAFWDSFKNNILITLLCVVGQIGIAFIFSAFLSARFLKFKSLHRVVAYFPSTISAVVVGFVWMFIFNYDYGLLNSLLRMAGAEGWAKAWLDNPNTIVLIVSIPLIWQYIGYYMVIIMAAMTSVDASIYEVAELDGASGIVRAIYITLPLIKESLLAAVMLCIAGNMKIFDHIYVMTNGGPGTSSMVMALNVYKTTFVKNRFGYASAMSVGVLVLSLLLVGVIRLIVMQPWKKEEN